MSIFESKRYFIPPCCTEKVKDRISVLNGRIVSYIDDADFVLLSPDRSDAGPYIDDGIKCLSTHTFLVLTEQEKPEVDPVGSILTEAESIVNGARASDYGSAHESFFRIANLTETLLDKTEKEVLKEGEIHSTIVVKMLLAVKLVRESNKHKRDNLVDLCGYAELLNRIQEGEA